MSADRRYPDEEIREIFELAATPRRAPERAPPSADGLTLAELQDIGREVGLEPERIAEAANAIDLRRETPPRRQFLGMPLSVARTVALPRDPTDREWAILVAELRETFEARGVDRSRGEMRHWANGNLHIYIEPTESGSRLRMRTLKGDAMSMNGIGLVMLLMAAFILAAMAVEGGDDLKVALFITMLGGGALAFNALRLPAWAREREAQMERVAARATMLLSGAPDERGPVLES